MVCRLTIAAVAVVAMFNPALAADAAHGKRLFFQRCAVCHTINSGGANGVGPNLFGIVDRKSGSLPGFNYSAAMKNAGLTWTADELTIYLADPAKIVPGTHMSFQGFSNPTDAADVVEFLKAQK